MGLQPPHGGQYIRAAKDTLSRRLAARQARREPADGSTTLTCAGMVGIARTPLPRVAPDALFVPFHEVRGRPHVVVDGPFGDGTVLGLSHWPNGRTPAALEADTSAGIVARYLDAAPSGPAVGVVTNNHFDEDGLLAAFLLLERPPPGELRARAIAAAEAGDFQTWTDPAAAWCAISLMAMAERPTTPLPDVMRALNRAGAHDPAGAITIALLPHVAGVLGDPDRYRRLWEPVWTRVEEDNALLDSGGATIEEIPDGDLAIVRAERPLSAFAVHPRITAMRVLTATPGGRLRLEHRYETWVRYVSRPLPPRVDLSLLLPRLALIETLPGSWRFDGVDHPQARLVFTDPTGAPAPSGLSSHQLADEILRVIAPAHR